jgi:PAS domain S-box-containing protein
METQCDHGVQALDRLRRCVSDLISLLTLPSSWGGVQPLQIAQTVLESLLTMLQLDLAYVRLIQPGEEPLQMVRTSRPRSEPVSLPQWCKVFDDWMQEDPDRWPRFIPSFFGEGTLSVAAVPLGMHGELGLIVACAERATFPEDTERLVLNVAANQAALGLQEARLLHERRRIASALDEQVAQRTAELAVANAELRREVAERWRAEEALRQSEARLAVGERDLQLTIDTIPVFVATYRPDGTRISVNRTWQEYMGLTLEEAITSGARTFPHFHTDDAERNEVAWRASLKSGEPLKLEVRVRRADGQYRWHTSHRVPLRGENGDIVKWYSVGIDIDDQKVAEDALRQSQARLAQTERELRKLINTIPALAWSARTDGTAEFLNQNYLDYVGLSLQDTQGWGWASAVHPDDLNALAATWQVSMASGESSQAEARLRRHDGDYRWFLFRVNPLRDDAGNIVKWYGVNTDIHDRKLAEERLRRSEAFLAEAQRLSSTGGFAWRVERDEITWSQQLYRIFEFDPDTPITLERIFSRIHPDDIGLLSETIDWARSNRSNFEYEHRLQLPDGSIKYLHLVAHAMRDERGRLEYIGAVQDVTPSRIAEQALSKARSELAHVSRISTVGALTASIAHEVNQPLSGIVTNASACLRMLAADPPNVERAQETARRMIRDGNRAADVITRLRALFAKKEVTAETLDLNDAVREVIALSLSDLHRSRMVVRAELAEDLPAVTGDRVQLQQVILNLLRNALDAMSEVENRPRQVVIKTEHDEDDRVRLSVQDMGVGLDPQSADKLFDAFYTAKPDGMGIGLSVSRSIIENHHGRLWATPNDGPGATFAFSIPRATADATHHTLSARGFAGPTASAS